MSILIKGMKMPENCSECQLCYDMMECSASNIRFFKKEEKVFDFCTERHPNCPLEELSADVIDHKHGRWEFIDSEQFEEVHVDIMRCSCCGDDVDMVITLFDYCIEHEYRYCPNCGAYMMGE